MIRPVGDNIIVKIESIEDNGKKTASGIILPKATVQEKKDKGEVVAVGEGRTLNNGEKLKPCVSAGDEIIFNCFAGTEVMIDDERLLIIREADILAVI